MALNKIILSDTHIGYEEQQAPLDILIRFLYEKSEIADEIILNGDIIEFWRRDMAYAMIYARAFIDALYDIHKKGKCKIKLIRGNHDEHFGFMGNSLLHQEPFRWTDIYTVQDENIEFVFVHGHLYDVSCSNVILNDNLCHLNDDQMAQASRAWEIFVQESSKDHLGEVMKKIEALFNENQYFKNQMMEFALKIPSKYWDVYKRIENPGMKSDPNGQELIKSNIVRLKNPNQFFIYGHTHVPALWPESMVANCGCWVEGQKDYIWIHDGEIELKSYNDEL